MSAREDRDCGAFLGLHSTLSAPESSQAVILPIPLEKTTSFMKGTRKGPEEIIHASQQVEFWDCETLKEPCQRGIHTDGSLSNPEFGDLSMKDSLAEIRQRASHWLDQDKFLLSLGGEHTITVGLIDPFIERYGKDLTIVQIDAHADLRDEYEGSKYSHACVMRRMAGRAPIVSLGIRSVDRDEVEETKNFDIQTFYAHQMAEDPSWQAKALDSIRTKKVYLTIDLDGFDPSVIPAVGTPEPGGLQWYETLHFLRQLGQTFEIVGADVNELCPRPSMDWVPFVVAKLSYKILGYALERT